MEQLAPGNGRLPNPDLAAKDAEYVALTEGLPAAVIVEAGADARQGIIDAVEERRAARQHQSSLEEAADLILARNDPDD